LAPYLTGPPEQRRAAELADLAPRIARGYQRPLSSPVAPLTHAWAGGLLARVEARTLTINQARRLARAPAARFLRALGVVGYCSAAACSFEPGPDVPADSRFTALDLLESAPWLANLRSFQLGAEPDDPDSPRQQHGFDERPVLPFVA